MYNSGRRGGGGWRGNKPRGPGRVPDKWLDFKDIGDRMAGSRFIIFKTPLKDAINQENDVPTSERFTPSILLSKIGEKREKLGLVLDMTKTTRYYDPIELTRTGIEYKKMQMEGHGTSFSDADVKWFQEVVDEYLAKNKGNDKLIGIHGTTSTNRPGYLICRYLIEKHNVAPSKAIEDFKKARGHPIDEQCYIDELMSLEQVRSSPPDQDDGDDDDFVHGLASASVSRPDDGDTD